MRYSTIDFEALRYLLAAAEVGTFGEAARALGIETASLSRRVSRVEDELGLTLFERGHSGVRLTRAGQAVMVHVRRALGDLDAIISTGRSNASGDRGQISLGIRLPSVGDPVQGMLREWRLKHPEVRVSLYEMNERDILMGVEERRLDLAFMTKHTLWPRAASIPVYREYLFAALPKDHNLARRKTLTWDALRAETFLVQGWEESQIAREYYASFLGSDVRFDVHAASKQSILGLVGAGFGVTLVTQAQSHVKIPGVIFRRILEEDAVLEIHLVWVPENEEVVTGRFVAFMRELSASRGLL
jgi:DNA-binding transcriptional LysR family regulator